MRPESEGPFRLLEPRSMAYVAGSLATQVLIATLGAYLPSLLRQQAQAGAFVIGLTAAILPLCGLAVQPFVNAASDRLRSRWGRRAPFLVFAAPLGAAGLWGLHAAGSVPAAVGCMALVGLGYVLMDGPYRASLSEEWEGHEVSVSAAQAMVKGFGTLLAFALVAWLGSGAFVAAALVWAGSVWLAAVALRARQMGPDHAAAAPPLLPRGAQRRFVLGLFFAWFGLQAVTAFAVSFVVHDLAGVAAIGSQAGQAAVRQAIWMLGAFAVTAMALALPVGRLAQRLGRVQTLGWGMWVMVAGYGVALLASQPWQAFAFALLGGVGFACLQVLPYPLLLEGVQPGREGRMATLYNITLDFAQLTTLVVSGWLIAVTHTHRSVFALALVATVLAAVLMAERRRALAPTPA